VTYVPLPRGQPQYAPTDHAASQKSHFEENTLLFLKIWLTQTAFRVTMSLSLIKQEHIMSFKLSEMLDLVHIGENLQPGELAEVIARVYMLKVQKMHQHDDISRSVDAISLATKNLIWVQLFRDEEFRQEIGKMVDDIAEEYVR
jgi:hypothetical protein